MTALRIIDVLDEPTFRRIPPCADPRFDHRTCDHWEDADRGRRDARPGWLAAPAPPTSTRSARTAAADNPFAPPVRQDPWNPFAPGAGGSAANPFDPFADDAPDGGPGDDTGMPPNPFAPTARPDRPRTSGVPPKLALLDRGRGVFGSYAKVLLEGEDAVAYAQFGPLSAYPRALAIRELYPRLPVTPLPAVITCISTTVAARRRGHARTLIENVCDDLAGRGFAAVEAYPDRTRPEEETSAAAPPFWMGCGFTLAVNDPRFPVMRRELG